MTVDEAVAADRRYFDEHPDTDAYIRECRALAPPSHPRSYRASPIFAPVLEKISAAVAILANEKCPPNGHFCAVVAVVAPQH
jgi:hypothetical protein